MNGCVIVTIGLLGIAMGKPCFSLIYQLLCQFLCHLLSQCLKESVFLPECKFTVLIPAKPTLGRFTDITAAGGTGANDLAEERDALSVLENVPFFELDNAECIAEFILSDYFR